MNNLSISGVYTGHHRALDDEHDVIISKASRWDAGTLAEPTRTAEGFLRVQAVLTRSGVFVYVLPDGSERRELRDDAEVLNPESLASLANVPVTAPHPEADGVRVKVTPLNFSTYAQGSVGQPTPRADGGVQVVESMLLIAGSAALKAIDVDGWRQVSCGYDCDLIQEAGEHPTYGKYDARQTNIRYNHAAVVPMGRAGSIASLRMDAADYPRGAQMADEMIPKTDDKLDDVLAKVNELIALLKAEPVALLDSPASEAVRMDAANEAYAQRKIALVGVATKLAVKSEGLSNKALVDVLLAKQLGSMYRADATDEIKSAQMDCVIAEVSRKVVGMRGDDSHKQTRVDALGAAMAAPSAGNPRETMLRNVAKLRNKTV